MKVELNNETISKINELKKIVKLVGNLDITSEEHFIEIAISYLHHQMTSKK